MRMNVFTLIGIASLFGPQTALADESHITELSGPYIGQAVPGLTAELFAPGVVSVTGRYEFAISFAPSGAHAMFTAQSEEEGAMVLQTRLQDGHWTDIEPVSLTRGARSNEMEAFFAPDGHTVYFSPYDEDMDVRIWQVTSNGDDWTNPQMLTGTIADSPAFYPTMANDGSLYYTNITERRPYVATQKEDGSWDARPVGVEFGGHVFIAPDQSFLLLDARAEDSIGNGDIYVAFPTDKGDWSKPINLGPGINSEFSESCPSLSADGKYLFFSRYNEEGGIAQIYWADAKVISKARERFESIDKQPILKGPYLGQKPPGLTAKIFAPGIVSTAHRDFSGFFSPDMKEFYFTRRDNSDEKWSLISYISDNDQWHKSTVTPRIGRPILSPDGNTMHLGKRYMTRTKEGWSEVKSLGPPFEDIPIMRLMSSSKGTYVLDEGSRDGQGSIRYSLLIDGKRQDPKPFGKEVNTGLWNAHPYLSPDESYLIWDGERESGFGSSDLYISYRQKDGSWSEAINMGDKINTGAEELGASVTPDGKYLFFNRYMSNGEGDIYWIDAKVIGNLRPK